MCFTIEVHTSRKAIEKRFSVDTSALKDFDFNYFYRAFDNPMIPVIPGGHPGAAVLMQWGLVPAWARDEAHAAQIRKGTYNARAESIHEKPSFSQAFRQGRCLILAHGFFEWQHVQGAKIPWYIRMKDEAPFAFAGLCDTWKDPESGKEIRTCSIITTRANPLMEKIHNSQKRMPVILDPGREATWVKRDAEPEEARQLLLPLDPHLMEAHTVGPAISSPGRVDPSDPKIIKPYSHHIPGKLF